MSLDAGSVYATLGGRYSSAGFKQFDNSLKSAVTSATSAEKRMTEANKRSEASLQALGHTAKVGAAAGLLAVGAAVAYSAKQAVTFEKEMRNVNSIAKLTEPQFKALNKSVLELSGKTAQAPKTLAEGMYQLVSSGFNAKDSLTILKSSAIAATAGLTTTEVATTAVAAALNAYHRPASDAAKVSDTLFETVNRGVIKFPELAATIGLVLPFANSLHVGLNQVGASISTLTKEGIPAANATTYLKNAMVAFLKPSKDLKAAIKDTGAASGEALVQQRGFQGALDAVAKTTDGTKGALQKLFPDIRASAAVFALTGSNAKTAAADVAAFHNTTGATAQVFAEQSKSAAVQWQKFTAELQAGAIVIGNAVLPMLTHAATQAGSFVDHLSKTGELKNLGQGAAGGLHEAGQVIGDLIPIVKGAAEALLGLAHALDLGDASHLEAIIAGIAGFKVAAIVAPLVLRLAASLRTLVAARNIGLLAPTILNMVNPLTAAAVAAGALGAAIILLSGREDAETRAARENAAAHDAQVAAIHALHAAEGDVVNGRIDAKQSTLDLSKAEKARADFLSGGGKKSSLEYKQLNLDVEAAVIRSGEAHKKYNTELERTATNQAKLKTSANNRLKTAADELKSAQDAVDNPHGAPRGGQPAATPEQLHRLKTAQDAYTKAMADFGDGMRVASLRQLDEQRIAAGQPAINAKNAAGFQFLAGVLNTMPKKVQTKYLLDGNQDALSVMGVLSARLISLGRQKTVTKILANSDTASEAVLAFRAVLAGVPTSKVAKVLATTSGTETVRELRSEINAVQSKAVTIAVTTVATKIDKAITFGGAKAAGRGPGRSEMALVGEGRAPEDIYDTRTGAHAVVDRPTFMALPDTAYVIPRDPAMRGRAAGLMMQLARQMGWGMHAGGLAGNAAKGVKPSKWLNQLIPDKLDPLALPLDAIAGQRTAALKRYTDAKDKAHDQKGKLGDLKHAELKLEHSPAKTKDQKAKKARDLAELRRKVAHAKQLLDDDNKPLSGLQKAYRARDKQWKDAKDFQAKIDKLTTLVNVDRNAMDLANKKHDLPGYNAAKAKRVKDLAALRALYAKAKKSADPDSQYFADLTESIGSTDNDIQDTSDSAPDDPDADALAQTGMTKTERDALAQIHADEALATLTPDTGDDIAAFNREVALLTTVLGEVQSDPARGGNEVIADIATQLHTAQENAKSATTDVTPDMQAQIDQANARADTAQAEVRAAAVYAQAAFGSGDIGAGGYGSAIGAAAQGPNITINTLHPGDPAVHAALAEAATMGFGNQNPRRAPRTTLGVF